MFIGRAGLAYIFWATAFLSLLTPFFAWATTVTASYGGVTYNYDPSTGAYSGSNGSNGYLAPEIVANLITTIAGVSVTVSNSYADNTSAPISFTTGSGAAQNQGVLSTVYNAVNYSSSANEIVQAAVNLKPTVNSASQNSDGTVNVSANVAVGGLQVNLVANNVVPPHPPKPVVAPVSVPYTITFSNPSEPIGGVADVFIEPEYESFEENSGPTGGSKYCPAGFTPRIVGGISHEHQFNTIAACIVYRTSSNQEGVTAIRVVAGGSAATCSSLGMTLRVTPPGSKRPSGGVPELGGVPIATCISKGTSNVLTEVVQTGGGARVDDCPVGFTPVPNGIISIKGNGSQTCVVKPVVPPSCPVISDIIPVSCDLDGNGTSLPLPPSECTDAQYSIDPPATPDGSTITLNAFGGVIHREGGGCNPPVISVVKFKVTEETLDGPYVAAAQLYVNEAPVPGRLTTNNQGGYNLLIREEGIGGTYRVRFKKSGYQDSDLRPLTIIEGDNGIHSFVLKKPICRDSTAQNSGGPLPCKYPSGGSFSPGGSPFTPGGGNSPPGGGSPFTPGGGNPPPGGGGSSSGGGNGGGAPPPGGGAPPPGGGAPPPAGGTPPDSSGGSPGSSGSPAGPREPSWIEIVIPE